MKHTTRSMRCVKVYRIKMKLCIMQEVVKTWESLQSMSAVVISTVLFSSYSILKYKYVGSVIRRGAFILTMLARLTWLTWMLRHCLDRNFKTQKPTGMSYFTTVISKEGSFWVSLNFVFRWRSHVAILSLCYLGCFGLWLMLQCSSFAFGRNNGKRVWRFSRVFVILSWQLPRYLSLN